MGKNVQLGHSGWVQNDNDRYDMMHARARRDDISGSDAALEKGLYIIQHPVDIYSLKDGLESTAAYSCYK